jgi:hypothetical protein
MDHHRSICRKYFLHNRHGSRPFAGNQWAPGTRFSCVAQARDVEFEAKYLGDWMVHCHLPHRHDEPYGLNGWAMSTWVMPSGRIRNGGRNGMIKEGPATAKENGPSIGRAMGSGINL